MSGLLHLCVHFVCTFSDAMLKAIEIDAKQRAERRKKKMVIANELKDKGNIQFQAGNYDAAVQLYTEVTHNVLIVC